MTTPLTIDAAVAAIHGHLDIVNTEIADLTAQLHAIDRALFRAKARHDSLSETLALLLPEKSAEVAPVVTRAKPGEVEAAVAAAMPTLVMPTAERVAESTGYKLSSVKAVLKKLVASGVLTQVGDEYGASIPELRAETPLA